MFKNAAWLPRFAQRADSVLNTFREPFVWQAVPMTAIGQGED